MLKKFNFSYRNELTLNIPEQGELLINSLQSRSAGLSYIHNVEILSENNIIATAKDFEVPYFWNVSEIFCSAFLKEGVYCEIIAFLKSRKEPYSTIVNPYQDQYKIKYDFNNKCQELLEKVKLKRIDEHYRDTNYFHFQKYVGIFNGSVIVDYNGHEVGGSYIPQEKVIPGYIERIENATSKKCTFVERKSGGFGFDVYRFNIAL